MKRIGDIEALGQRLPNVDPQIAKAAGRSKLKSDVCGGASRAWWLTDSVAQNCTTPSKIARKPLRGFLKITFEITFESWGRRRGSRGRGCRP
jgi:hypothetical protein